jgi:hypothetical protein
MRFAEARVPTHMNPPPGVVAPDVRLPPAAARKRTLSDIREGLGPGIVLAEDAYRLRLGMIGRSKELS